MKNKCVLLVLLLLTSHAHAALYDRSGGLIYDDVLDVTWLQDANYGAGSRYDDGVASTDGLMTVIAADAWASSLNYFDSARNVTWTDWRLPRGVDTGLPGCDYAYSNTDCGFNVKTQDSGGVLNELAYMFYINLDNKAYADTAGMSPQSGWGLPNLGPFINLRLEPYWLLVEQRPGASSSWYFDMYYGAQLTGSGGNTLRAWAVRDGDVASVPEPDTWAMLLAGLGLIVAGVRRKEKLESRHKQTEG